MADISGTERNTLYFNGINDWNSLPNELNTCENICSFKQRVKRHLLKVATDETGKDFLFFYVNYNTDIATALRGRIVRFQKKDPVEIDYYGLLGLSLLGIKH